VVPGVEKIDVSEVHQRFQGESRLDQWACAVSSVSGEGRYIAPHPVFFYIKHKCKYAGGPELLDMVPSTFFEILHQGRIDLERKYSLLQNRLPLFHVHTQLKQYLKLKTG